MGNKSSIKANYLYNLGYQILQIMIPILTTPYISRVLGAKNIGIYSVVNANLTYFILIGVLGLGTYSQLEIAKLRDNKEEMSQFFFESFVARLITMGISFIGFVIFYFYIGEYEIYYLICGILLFANAIDVTWLLQGVENFKFIAFKDVGMKILTLICIFVFVKEGNDLWKYMLINCGGILLGNLINFSQIKKYIVFKKCRKLQILKQIKNAMAYFLPSIASVVITTVDKTMLSVFTDSSVQNGYYEQAMKIEGMLFGFFSALNITMRSRMSYLSANGKIEERQRKISASMQFVLFLSLPFSFGLFCVSDYLVPWFFGVDFLPVSGLLKILAVWMLFKTLSNCILEQFILPSVGIKVATVIMWIGAFSNILLNRMFIPGLNASGAAIASGITEFVILICTVIKSKEMFKGIDIKRIIWKKFIAVTIMCIVLIGCGFLWEATLVSTMIQVMLGATIYISVLIILGDEMGTELLKCVKMGRHNK